jgi:hypothetical protein
MLRKDSRRRYGKNCDVIDFVHNACVTCDVRNALISSSRLEEQIPKELLRDTQQEK